MYHAGRWQPRPLRSGLPPLCPDASALVISPDYPRDRTLLAGIVGNGIFRSTDAGALWTPASRGLTGMGIDQLLLSPGFPHDGTAFARAGMSPLQRTVDGGASWQTLPITPTLVALSPEFDQDRTLVGFVQRYDRPSELWTSTNDGMNWDVRPLSPPLDTVAILSAAPLYAKWRVLFALNGAGTLLRSTDGGASWQEVLASGLADSRAQIAYAPDLEVDRPVFLLLRGVIGEAQPSTWWGKLFRSMDGGISWQELALEDGVVPPALTISPRFAGDGLIFVGTTDGRVLSLDGLALPAAG